MVLAGIQRASTAPAGRSPVARWRHVPGLDGLRALAVVAVLLFHAGYLRGGFLGVDLFFALSGFLITSLLLRDATDGGVSLGAFWGRRARRLLPAVLTMLVVVSVWAAAFGSPADLDGVRRDGPWALLYVANWHFIAEAGGYWQSFSQPSMFDHLWSLAIEEQFYLLWPLAIVAAWRWARRPQTALFITCVSGIALSFVLMVVLHRGGDPTRVYMGTDTRAASLLAGALAATSPARRATTAFLRRVSGATSGVIAVVGALVLWSWASVDGATSAGLYHGGLLLHSLACALLVALVAGAPDGPGARVLGWAPLAWVGVMSYGLYLWHWPVYVVLSPERTGWGAAALLVPRLALSTALAVASYQVIEDPIRRRAAWARTRRGIPVLIGSIAAVALVLGLLPTPATEIAAFDPASVRTATPDTVPATPAPAPLTPVADDATAPSATTPVATIPSATTPATTAPATSATTPDTTLPATTAPPPSGPIGGAIWAGDSIAYDLAPGVSAALTAAGVPVDIGAAFMGLRLGHLDQHTSLLDAVEVRLSSQHPGTVVVQLSVWDASLDDADQAAALTALRDAVLASSARLVVVDPPPGPDEGTNAGVTRMAAVARGMSDADPTRVVYLDSSVVWGTTSVLDLDGDGTPERKNDHIHICPSGAARFGAWLADQLAAHFTGVTPADPTVWATGPWVTDERYNQPVGTCASVG